MKPVILILIALFGLLQYELWFSTGGLRAVWQLKQQVSQQQATNQQAKLTNQALVADIRDLKGGNEAIQERARNNLGMIQQGETFYQIVDQS
ncbi:MAG: cell division protein FtsB [Coxiellaceae bacterium]|nr:cell division protein FtsB [Coxiellaceae bacterium]